MDKGQFISGVTEKYDSRLLENSLTTEGNVCGVLLSDLTFYDDCGLESKDFVTKHGRMLFNLGKQLREKGLSDFDEISVLSNATSDVKEKIENELGGFRAIQNIIDVVSVKNMDAFMDELNKRNVLMSLYSKNFNIFDEITLDSGKKVMGDSNSVKVACEVKVNILHRKNLSVSATCCATLHTEYGAE